MMRPRGRIPLGLLAGSLLLVSLLLLTPPAQPEPGQSGRKVAAGLTLEQASSYARLALKAIRQEYPNKPGHVLTSEADNKVPRALHPAFYGSYDWHSSVHGHWVLVRLLRLFP